MKKIEKEELEQWEKVHNEFGDLSISYQDYAQSLLDIEEPESIVGYWDWIEQEYISFLKLMNGEEEITF